MQKSPCLFLPEPKDEKTRSILSNANYWKDIVIKAKWTECELEESFKEITTCICENGINLSNNEEETILKSIIHIDFGKLKWLSLAFNNITSIESLSYLNAPMISKIFLDHNRIHSIKPFRKSSPLNHLTTLYLNHNHITEILPLTHFNAPILKLISLQYEMDSACCYSLSNIIKIQSNLLNELWILSQSRFQQLELCVKLENKYDRIFIARK